MTCAALVAACGANSDRSAARPAGDTDLVAEQSPLPAPGSNQAQEPAETVAPQLPSTITLAFAGDVHFERQVAGLLKQSDEAWRVKLPELRDADFAMVNLETALGTSGRPEPKTYTFRAPAESLAKLATAGVDAVSMANNHAVDYGRTGLEDTLAIIENNPMPVVGIGRTAAEAFAPHTVDIKGVNTAVLASSQVVEETYANWSATKDGKGIATDKNPELLREAVRAAAQTHDLVVVFMHWGIEGSSCPSERQMNWVDKLGADGADIIVGAHAHRLQANGWKDRAFVGLGLGNFIWYNSAPDSRRSGVLTVTVDAETARERGTNRRPADTPLVTDFEWTPKRIAGDGEPMSVEGAARADVVAAMDRAIACSSLDAKP